MLYCITDIKNSNENLESHNLSAVVKAVFTLSGESGDTKRQFSKSKCIVTEDKTLISLKNLNTRLYIEDGIQKYLRKSRVNSSYTKNLLVAAL